MKRIVWKCTEQCYHECSLETSDALPNNPNRCPLRNIKCVWKKENKNKEED